MIASPNRSMVGAEDDPNECSVTTVVGISRTSQQLSVALSDGRTLSLNPFTYVKVGSRLVEQHRNGALIAIDKMVDFAPAGSPKSVRIHPTYRCEEAVVLPPHKLRVTFRERANTLDWKAARLLEQFHYRGKGLNRLVGRRTVLLLDAGRHWSNWLWGALSDRGSGQTKICFARHQLYGPDEEQTHQ